MSAKITRVIPLGNFELIRDRVCEILALELNEQVNQDSSFPVVGVWCERFTSFNLDELDAIKVYLIGLDFDHQDVLTQRDEIIINIDIHTARENLDGSEKIDGSKLSALKNHRIGRAVQYILSSAEYYILGFDPGIISNRRVDSYRIGEPENIQDSAHILTGRVQLKVTACESVPGIQPIPSAGFDTSVKVETSENGFKYTINNTP